MKSSALLIALFLNFSVSHAADDNTDLGNPEVDAAVATCANEVNAQYKALLAEPYSCGALLIEQPLVNRASKAYQSRFELRTRQLHTRSKYDSQTMESACGYLAAYCIDSNPKLTTPEKETSLRKFIEQPQ